MKQVIVNSIFLESLFERIRKYFICRIIVWADTEIWNWYLTSKIYDVECRMFAVLYLSGTPGSNVSATPIGQTGLQMGWFSLGNGVWLIMKKAPSDSPIWQLKKRELLLPLSFLITKPLNLDLSNFHYRPHNKPHYRTQGCVIRENNITTPLRTPLRTL